MGDFLYAAAFVLAAGFLTFAGLGPRLPDEPFWIRGVGAFVGVGWAAIVVTDLFTWFHG